MDSRRHNESSEDPNDAERARREVVFVPRMDIHESKGKNEFTVTFEIPGVKKEDVTVDIHQNRLRVSGVNRSSNGLDEEGYRLRERRVGRFVRVIILPSGIKPADMRVKLENGILTIRFPKTSAENAPKSFKLKDLAKL